MTVDEAKNLKKVAENTDCIIQLIDTVAKTMIKAFGVRAIEGRCEKMSSFKIPRDIDTVTIDLSEHDRRVRNKAIDDIVEKVELKYLGVHPDELHEKYYPREICEQVKELAEKLKEGSEIMEEKKYNNGWIPCSERLPENDEYILVSFDNYPVPAIGRYEGDEDNGGAFYPEDEAESYSSYGVFVNAWMPLPKSYKGE